MLDRHELRDSVFPKTVRLTHELQQQASLEHVDDVVLEGIRKMTKGGSSCDRDSESVGISKKTTNAENWPSGVSGVEEGRVHGYRWK